jgi:hypothetical protein
LRTSITIVASPRPRVGKTLLARVLTDYLAQNGCEPLGFDLGGGDGGLSNYLPERAALASLDDIKAQMSLFDALVANDHRPKIVDLGADLFADFFELADQFGLVEEAATREVGIALLYIVTPDGRSLEAVRALLLRFPEMTLTPVHNEIFGAPPHRQIDSIGARQPLLKLPALAASARKYIERPPFSFADPQLSALLPGTAEAELDAWLHRVHRDLRELERHSIVAEPVRFEP